MKTFFAFDLHTVFVLPHALHGSAAGWPVVVGLAVWGSVVPLGELVVLEDDVDGVHVLLSQGFCALGARLHNCEYVAICNWLQMVHCNGGKE